MDYIAELEAGLTGRPCLVTRREFDWYFDLGDERGISISVPWRIVYDGRIARTSYDDGKWFGRPTPVDLEADARAGLSGKLVSKVTVDHETADLTLYFDDGRTRIDIFNNSAGHEGWQASFGAGKGIALGGGSMAFY